MVRRGTWGALVIPAHGALRETGDPFEPFRLLDADRPGCRTGRGVSRDLSAGGSPETTQRSYGLALLRWFRFLGRGRGAVGSGHAGRSSGLLPVDPGGGKPVRPHWRASGPRRAARPGPARPAKVVAESGDRQGADPGRVTRRRRSRTARRCCAASTSSTCRRVGPMVNPFPLAGAVTGSGRTRTTIRWSRSATSAAGCSGRGCRGGCRGGSRTRGSTSCSPRLPSHRDRALVAFWVSTGARASELLGVRAGDADPGPAADHGGA